MTVLVTAGFEEPEGPAKALPERLAAVMGALRFVLRVFGMVDVASNVRRWMRGQLLRFKCRTRGT